ncbi:MAG: type II methionyl aminopeptidase [Candidatus Micrarchaeota archaeon]
MEIDGLDKYLEASQIAKKIMKYGRELVKKETGYLKIASSIEEETKKLGAKPAFPVNISVNGIAAHDTPELNDTREVKPTDLVKVDFGAMIEGFCIDTAFSYSPNNAHAKLIEAAEMALQNALSVVKAGVSTKAIGKEIETTIKQYGYLPVENLCGHSLEEYNLHAGVEIPNVERGGHILKEGEVFAIEPFASTGAGRVNDGDYCQIWSLNPQSNLNVRLPKSRELLGTVAESYMTMPFAARWIKNQSMLFLSLRDLEKQGALESYPVLKEAKKDAFVSQAETTLIVEENGAKILV